MYWGWLSHVTAYPKLVYWLYIVWFWAFKKIAKQWINGWLTTQDKKYQYRKYHLSFNQDIFQGHEFMPSSITDRPLIRVIKWITLILTVLRIAISLSLIFFHWNKIPMLILVFVKWNHTVRRAMQYLKYHRRIKLRMNRKKWFENLPNKTFTRFGAPAKSSSAQIAVS